MRNHDTILFAIIPSLVCIAIAAIVAFTIVAPIVSEIAKALGVLS